MTKTKKRIGMVAPPEDMHGLVEWAQYNKETLETAIIYATRATAGELEDDVGLRVRKNAEVLLNDVYPLTINFKESSKGGDMEIGCLVVQGMLDYLVYFWNTVDKEPHDDDTKAVLRHSVSYDVPTACNRNTADHLISSPYFFGRADRAEGYSGDVSVNIALVAHDGKKDALLGWVNSHKGYLEGQNLFATGTTGGRIIDETGLDVTRMKSGPKGGDVEISALILNKALDYLIFFWDPETAQPHDVDVKALLRNAVYRDIATACNPATANHLVTSVMFPNQLYDSLRQAPKKG